MNKRKLETYQRDDEIVRILNAHRGRRNAIGANEIRKCLRLKGYSVQSHTVRTRIKKIMYERHMPVCFDNSKGYYLPSCREDVLAVIADCESRIDALKEHINHLNQFIF